MLRKIFAPGLFFFLYAATAFSQSAGNYDQHEAFAPLFYPAFGDEVRTAAGTPGPQYWQNEADYNIQATLDDVNHQISGTVQITYKNNSPGVPSFFMASAGSEYLQIRFPW